MQSHRIASDKQRALPLEAPEDEPVAGNRGDADSVDLSPLLERAESGQPQPCPATGSPQQVRAVLDHAAHSAMVV